jgi:hypothetical protein
MIKHRFSKKKKLSNKSWWFIKSNIHIIRKNGNRNSIIHRIFTQSYVVENIFHIGIQKLVPDSVELLLLRWTEYVWICNAITFYPAS